MSNQIFQLLVEKGPEPGKVYELGSVNITIGRDPMADITIPDPEVSRQHVRLVQTLIGYSIQDLGSTNGTFVDGQRLKGDTLELKPGQTISMGAGVTLRFLVEYPQGLEQETILDISPVGTETISSADMPEDPIKSEEVAPSIEVDESEERYSQEDEIEAAPSLDLLEVDESAQPVFQDDPLEQVNAEFVEESPSEYRSEGYDYPIDEPSEEIAEAVSGSPEAESYQSTEDIFDSEEDAEDDFLQPLGGPVVIPHGGEPDLDEPENRARGRNRTPIIIVSALLIVLCCCCSFILFVYYYGGDWLLRQMGLLP